MDKKHESVLLKYTIHKYSSYSANYIPENIMVNCSVDPVSRWFTDSSTQSQYIMLKLKSPSIVETIKFGKYMKAHVSNLKKFQVLGGTEENNLSLLLSAGLKNNSTPEVFRIRHKTQEGLHLPITYLKIVPLQSWGPAYNYTIWYVELMGKNQEDFVTNALETINLRKEEEAVRLLLKHLRRRRYKDAFEALSRESGVKLEGAVQARLWNALVENGDYKLAEEIFQEAADDGELEWYLSWQPYSPAWRQMSPCSAGVEARLGTCGDAPAPPLDLHSADRDLHPHPHPEIGTSAETGEAACGLAGCCGKPGPRGGHQLVVDSATGTLYLFGGWSGTKDLDDLWAYSTREQQWALLCRHSHAAGGPSPRSCHKMVFDPTQRRLYTLGRYLDNAQRVPQNMKGDLYSYDVRSGAWALECDDTARAGGPRLVFDHQMCIDADTQTIYVFGGRVLPANSEECGAAQYSGLYAYYIRTGAWQLLLADRHALAAPQPRVSHSMLFHPVARRLYIFAGQRNKEHLVDMWWWDVATGECRPVCLGCAAPPPLAGFTQRATLDPDTDEMYVLSGMSKEKERGVYNTLWVFSLRRLTWACVYRNERAASPASPAAAHPEPREPRPRFAHQLVFDPATKTHYLFGGNPGVVSSPRLRLDDLWSLRLARVAACEVVRGARAAVREAAYRALCAGAGTQLAALHFLRTELNDVTDHADPTQVARFQKLAMVLFSGEANTGAGAGAVGAGSACVALTPQRVRALARRRAGAAATVDLAHALAVVLGAEDTLEPSQPFEEVAEPEPDTWEVGRDEDGAAPGAEWRARQARMQLYDELASYFRPSTVPPPGDIMDLVTL